MPKECCPDGRDGDGQQQAAGEGGVSAERFDLRGEAEAGELTAQIGRGLAFTVGRRPAVPERHQPADALLISGTRDI
jgi:hypothetical protein